MASPHLLHPAAPRRPSVLALPKPWPGRIHSAQAKSNPGVPVKHCFTGKQVRIPMSEVKNYIAERIKF